MPTQLPELEITPPWKADRLGGSGTSGAGVTPPSPGLLEAHYRDPYLSWKSQPNPHTAGALLSAVHPVLEEAARSYAGTEAATPTAMAHAKRLALEAFERYDPERAKLKTHLLSHLRGLRRITQKAVAPVHVPEQARIDSYRLSSAVPELTERLGRHPSDAELADHTGIPLRRLARARAVPGVLAASQAGDQLTPETHDKAAWDKWVEAIHLDSNPIDQVILERSLGLHGHPVTPAHEIAAMVGLSPGAVSLRKQRLQRELDAFDEFLGRHSGT